jgi:predicted Zn-ribbon and HTH transcriptional regulator
MSDELEAFDKWAFDVDLGWRRSEARIGFIAGWQARAALAQQQPAPGVDEGLALVSATRVAALTEDWETFEATLDALRAAIERLVGQAGPIIAWAQPDEDGALLWGDDSFSDVRTDDHTIPLCLAGQAASAEPVVAWLNTKHNTLHHADGLNSCADVRELIALYAGTPPSAVPAFNKPLVWLWTHCRAIGMTKKSDSGSMEDDIALFTIDLKAAAVPEGWQPVPKEPTAEMQDAGYLDYSKVKPHHVARMMYQAMLAAAPQPIAQPEQGKREPTMCGSCEYEEADGSLIEQCPRCKAKDAQPERSRIEEWVCPWRICNHEQAQQCRAEMRTTRLNRGCGTYFPASMTAAEARALIIPSEKP